MSKQAENKSSRWIFSYLAATAVGLPLLYLLSVGPAIILAVKLPATEQVLETIYSPIVWLHDQTPLRKPIDSYFEFWFNVAKEI